MITRKSSTRIWIWRTSKEEILPAVNFDYKASPVSSSSISDTTLLDLATGSAVLDAKQTSRAAFSGIDAPDAMSVPLISGRVVDAVSRFLQPDEYQIFPATIRCSDGELTEYSFLRPLSELACVDLQRSDIDFKEILQFFKTYRKIVLSEKGLRGLNLASEKHAGFVYVSDALRDVMIEFKGVEEHLYLPEELPLH